MERPHIAHLDWDEWSRDHIAKHHVLPEEVDEIIAADFVTSFRSYKQRFIVTGRTSAGRIIAIVIGAVPEQPDVYYVFSARPASPREKRQYEEMRKGAGL